ncbi:DEAD/DEAH box helicase [Streptomyces boluensis]|uniref:DEAD/DEAH box helicase family protein n=1 Tax=Streptomyces boluensis TaxID=1775135 RepID=A0A964XR26_9ACTN|nr:DEAD/DEAH box helicase [Streptomyces boluensis]NBE56392.1 DEAD/DEAH box helicase family protein [Streptomyces boluensis]
MSRELRPHQIEAVDATLRALQSPATGHPPAHGLRAQVIAATGSGKTRIATETAVRLKACQVLVLVPTLDLLLQMATAWREGGRGGAMVGVCSLRAENSDGVPCTTDPAELASWVQGLEQVTVFATYASVGMGILQRAHEAGLGVWDLMVVDEAHRTSGDGLKPWAAVHDQQKIPAARRLYMTATARVWEADEGGAGGREPRMVASMSPDSPVFGPVAYKLTLSEAISRGIVAPYQVVCVDISDPAQAVRELIGTGTDEVRGARLAALQTGVLTAAAQENLRKILTFHSRVAEAEAMAEGLPAVARRLWENDRRTYPDPERVWAGWLYGEHPPAHRRAVLEEFASDVIEDQEQPAAQGGVPRLQAAAVRVLASVKVLGEGVDTADCDSVAFCDVRGSMVDIVQMVGRALRMQPGDGKIASLIVPVFLAEGEKPDDMLTSPAYGALAKVLGALRAHDTDTIEALADSRPRSGHWTEAGQEQEGPGEGREQFHGDDGEESEAGASAGARELLKFSTPRDPAELARFVKLRVLEPENEFFRRGIAACTRYVKETRAGQLRVPYDYVTPDDWSPAGFPLGTWLADQRRFNKTGALSPERAGALEKLGMVWSHRDVAFEEGLAAARNWAAEHGHFLPPATAIWDGYPIGTWAKNQRQAAHTADTLEERREAGLPVESSVGALTQERREALDQIDAGWCPVWDVGWQRCFRLTQQHIDADGSLPQKPGETVVQGEDLGRWVQTQRHAWQQLRPAQQWLLANILNLQPAHEDERPVKRTQDTKWNLNLTAARQYQAREGHLNVPRKHVEQLPVGLAGPAASGRETTPEGTIPITLGTFIANARRRAAKLTQERHNDLDQLGMRW